MPVFVDQTAAADGLHARLVSERTEPNPRAVLPERGDRTVLERSRDRCRISIEPYRSVDLAIVGHYDGTVNPVRDAHAERAD